MLNLYFSPGTIAIAVAIALEEAGIAYDTTRVNFAEQAQSSPEYLAMNPKGRVPTLVTDAGTRLTETGAVLEYIATLAPTAQLTPQDAEDAAHMRAVMYYLASTVHVAHAHKMRGSRWADQQDSWDDMRRKVPQTMSDCAAYIQSNCLRGDFVLGDRFSVADPYLFIACNWLEGDGVDLADVPQIAAYLSRMEQRDSVKAVRAKGML